MSLPRRYHTYKTSEANKILMADSQARELTFGMNAMFENVRFSK